jgi:hypothetical protein
LKLGYFLGHRACFLCLVGRYTCTVDMERHISESVPAGQS